MVHVFENVDFILKPYPFFSCCFQLIDLLHNKHFTVWFLLALVHSSKRPRGKRLFSQDVILMELFNVLKLFNEMWRRGNNIVFISENLPALHRYKRLYEREHESSLIELTDSLVFLASIYWSIGVSSLVMARLKPILFILFSVLAFFPLAFARKVFFLIGFLLLVLDSVSLSFRHHFTFGCTLNSSIFF